MVITRITLFAILAWGLAGISVAAEPPKEIAVGEWSQPVTDTRGYAVRGRLVLAEKRKGDDLRETAVYIELQDASEHVGGSMRLFCDLGKTDFRELSKTGLTCVMHDKDKRPVAPTSPPFGGGTPASEWIHLPSDATIRLRASPFGIRQPGAMTISPHIGTEWVINDNDHKEYYLSGTFTIDPEEGRNTIADPQIWRGTLDLPAVQIVNQRKSLAP